MRWFRTESGLVARQLGQEDIQIGGINRWQLKDLGSDINVTGTVPGLSFNNLIIGNQYRYYSNVMIEGQSSGDKYLFCNASHGGGPAIAHMRARTDISTVNWDETQTMSTTFVAIATSVEFVISSVVGCRLRGRGANEAIAILEELNNYSQETSAFE